METIQPHVKEILEKQLELLSKCSQNAYAGEISQLSLAMAEIAKLLMQPLC